MQPLSTVSVTRPWHWGIAIISDPSLGGDIPEVEPDTRVSANRNGIIVLVRHAQDLDHDDTPDDLEWAQATVTVRQHSEAPAVDSDKTTLFEGEIATPTSRLWIGDADEDIEMSGLSETSAIRVLANADDVDSPDHVWVDVWVA